MILFGGMILCGVSLAMILAWQVRLHTGQSGYIDAIWVGATGIFALVAIFCSPTPPADDWQAALVAGFVACWMMRLSGHIFVRSRGAAEDPRYRELARAWGDQFPRKLFIFLQVQAAAALPLIVAAALAAHDPRQFPDAFDLLGAVLAIVGLAGEAIADRQLLDFRRRTALISDKPRVCRVGLWAWSRHPNYFFEFLFWCAMPLFAGPTLAGAVALAAPALMYVLLVHVSGAPPLEAHLRATRGPAFDAYVREVNCFFPAPPRLAPEPATSKPV